MPDAVEAKRVFEALADGGEVFMPFAPRFFSGGFGACLDRFGVNWMVDTSGDADSPTRSGQRQLLAVVGSIILPTGVTTVAGKPLRSACSAMSASLSAT